MMGIVQRTGLLLPEHLSGTRLLTGVAAGQLVRGASPVRVSSSVV